MKKKIRRLSIHLPIEEPIGSAVTPMLMDFAADSFILVVDSRYIALPTNVPNGINQHTIL